MDLSFCLSTRCDCRVPPVVVSQNCFFQWDFRHWAGVPKYGCKAHTCEIVLYTSRWFHKTGFISMRFHLLPRCNVACSVLLLFFFFRFVCLLLYSFLELGLVIAHSLASLSWPAHRCYTYFVVVCIAFVGSFFFVRSSCVWDSFAHWLTSVDCENGTRAIHYENPYM